MYLEETEQSDAPEHGPLLTDSILAEQCQVAELTDNNGSAALDGNVLVELSEQLVANRVISPSRLCMEHCNNCEDFTSDKYSGNGSILECITIHDTTLRLSHPLERRHVRPCRTSEPCVNHSSAHNGSPCCTEQQQNVIHERTNHPSEYSDLVVEKFDMNSDSFKQCQSCGCLSDYIERLDLSQQYTPSGMQYKRLDYKPETSIEDCEKHKTTGFIGDALESADESDCDTELSEYADIQNQSMAEEDNDEWGYLSDDSQERVTDDELCTVSEDVDCLPRNANLNKSEGHIVATDHLNTTAYEDLKEKKLTSGQNYSDKTFAGFFLEDDASSDGSSSESKSFKTCAEDSENSLNSSESEKEAQEDWSDEQTQWESCEDDEEQYNISETVHDEKKTCNFVLEDYFDLFDRCGCDGPTITQSQSYISCFDGGDIYDCLYGDQLKAKKQPQNPYKVTEMNPQTNDSSEKSLEGIYGCESEARAEDCKVEYELEDACEETHVNGARTCDVAALLIAPSAQNILVKYDAFDDISRVATDKEPNIVYCHSNVFCACSEKESYCSLMERDHGILDLVSSKHFLSGVVLNEPVHAACPEKSQVRKADEHCSARGESKDSNQHSSSIEISREVRADIIHSVVDKTEDGDALVQIRWAEDSEDEDCDGDPAEFCDCEYCMPTNTQVPTKALLPQLESLDTGKICVVIDLDETLVHSSFTPVNHADFITPVDIDGTVHQVYVSKRPHVDEFLRRMGEMFECVLFTASLSKYADPVSDVLDKWGAFRSRLFREACVFHNGNYVKDLSHLGRDLNKVIIIDNSPASYTFHPDNAVPVVSWFDDMSDSELLDLIPFFERLSSVDDVYDVLKEQRSLG